MKPLGLALLLLLTACAAPEDTPPPPPDGPKVLLVTLDGLRWEELFTGADPWLLDNPAYTDDADGLRARFWNDAPQARRQQLMPFFWEVIATAGQLYGHRPLGSTVDVTNGHVFSYPGYNEILTGFADDGRINSNNKADNPNITVLEAIHQQPGFEGRVAAFGSWDVFPYIINETRSGIPVNAGFRTAIAPLSDKERFLNELQPQVPSPWATVRLDAFTHHYALEHLKHHQPRLLYIAYGETDDFAHDGDYDAYLTSAHQTDAFIRELWTYVQATPGYRDQTTLIITTDHGRGTEDAWTGHGTDVDGATAIWLAVLGPQTEALGEVRNAPPLYQNQVAATVAALLGVDYTSNQPIGPPVAAALAP